MTVTQVEQGVLDERTEALLAVIRERRSVGKFSPDLPPPEAIETMLEAGTWAPCHHVTEPWRFVVIAGDERARLADIMARAKVERLERKGRPTEGEYDRAFAKAMRAPVILAVGVEPQPGPKVVEIEEVEAGAAAVQNMLLVAQSLGLATIWKTGDPAYDPAVKAFLGLTPAAHIIAFVYVGYPEASPVRARHTHHAALTEWRGWT